MPKWDWDWMQDCNASGIGLPVFGLMEKFGLVFMKGTVAAPNAECMLANLVRFSTTVLDCRMSHNGGKVSNSWFDSLTWLCLAAA